jgi:hypothetical protein
VLHNWQQLYKVCLSPDPYSYHSSHLISRKEKAIASRKYAAAGGGSTVRSICEVVGCITMLRNEDCRQVFPLLLPPLPLLQLDSFFLSRNIWKNIFFNQKKYSNSSMSVSSIKDLDRLLRLPKATDIGSGETLGPRGHSSLAECDVPFMTRAITSARMW